jgi:hypothetical protein
MFIHCLSSTVNIRKGQHKSEMTFCLASSESVFCLNATILLILSQNFDTSLEILEAVRLICNRSSYLTVKSMNEVHNDLCFLFNPHLFRPLVDLNSST